MPDKRMSTHFDIVRRADSRKNKPKSAVEAASYISRSVLEIERTGEKTYPKYHEDLVHSEILLPKQAPREYADRQTLWNAVEKNEKHCRAQLARSFRAGLPNEWTYEQATEIVRDFVQKNFVDKGMCADFAIHDSVNDKGQRNLHFHLLLTMTPILENGEWGKRQEKPHKLDKNGEWARDKKGRYIYDKPIQLTDWNKILFETPHGSLVSVLRDLPTVLIILLFPGSAFPRFLVSSFLTSFPAHSLFGIQTPWRDDPPPC